MKQLIWREQNSIKTCSENLHWELMLMVIAMDLLSKGVRTSVNIYFVGSSPKLDMNIVRWCSYKRTF